MQAKKLDYYKVIADNIKKLRLNNHYSQEQFSEIIGCSREYVSRLENYKEKISLQLLLHIAEIFNQEPQTFFNAN
ncbi:MAG: helix-turn-helix domain-containing protein [Candidatus Gastranaerophilales bacterium]|nr:helix-turn-helix domain-containing protein [Candidatus Gastranaerophilales bacterium]